MFSFFLFVFASKYTIKSYELSHHSGWSNNPLIYKIGFLNVLGISYALIFQLKLLLKKSDTSEVWLEKQPTKAKSMAVSFGTCHFSTVFYKLAKLLPSLFLFNSHAMYAYLNKRSRSGNITYNWV